MIDDAAIIDARPAHLIACSHCGLPVPTVLVDPANDDQFCCAACQTVYRVVHECGLNRYYELRRELETDRAPARTTGADFSAFDAPEFQQAHCIELPDSRHSIELYLEGVHCAACVWLIEKLPQIRTGVVQARLDLPRSLVSIVWDDDRAALSTVARDLDRLGYPPHPARGGEARAARTREDRRLLIRVAVAGALAGNVMLLAIALYSGMFDSMQDRFAALFRWVSMGLGVAAIGWPGSIFFKGAIASIRARTPRLDLPIALALSLAGAAGAVNVVRGSGEIYFDSLTMLVFLLLVGRVLQRSAQRRAADAVELLYSLTPASVTLVENDELLQAPIEAVIPGAILLVRAGETIPVDGVVNDGLSQVDESILTGESKPVSAAPGRPVSAGAVNLSAPIRVRAQTIGDATRLGRILKQIESEGVRSARVQSLVDRLSAWFLISVLSLASVTLLLWLAIDPSRAVSNTIALLIVTCPCGLGLATPLAVAAALGKASQRGIFVKCDEALTQLAHPGLLLLDKTGTLTEGGVRLVQWIGAESLRPAVAALESASSHPIGRALCADVDMAAAPTADDAEHFIGQGAVGVIDGARLVVGSFDFVQSQWRTHTPNWASLAQHDALEKGLTPIAVARGGAIEAVAVMGDRVRDDAGAALETLRNRGWRVGIVSGDDRRVVEEVAAQLGGEFAMLVGGASPEKKCDMVENAMRKGPVAFVGDGVNDAAALQRATVGIAAHGGAEASLAAADIYLTKPGLTPLVELIAGARRTRRVVFRNIGAALGYNALAATLALTGLITPIVAAILMPISSLTVLTLSIRARTFTREEAPCP